MLAIESEEMHHQPPVVVRYDQHVEAAVYMRRLHDFGVSHRSTEGPCDAGHLILDILLGTRSVTAIGNCYRLRGLSEFDLPSAAPRLPPSHWLEDWALALL
jgi:hypothetical protein